MLITGGTVFVSRYAAEYYTKKYDVYVLNRNTRPQSEGVTLIEADRHALGSQLREHYFDVVLDITAYDAEDVKDLLDALGGFGDYVLISSSAVYPENTPQPFAEQTITAENKYWGKYGTNKIAAERTLLERVPDAYILRPPYLYGPGNNVYRETFVFECAMQGRKFCLPTEGNMRLQFFHVDDLFRFVDVLLDEKPTQRIYNVGNADAITIREWVTLCYQTVGKTPEFVEVGREVEQRKYFPFYDYEYMLDVSKQTGLMPETKPLAAGLRESYEWYLRNSDKVIRKPLLDYIDKNLL